MLRRAEVGGAVAQVLEEADAPDALLARLVGGDVLGLAARLRDAVLL